MFSRLIRKNRVKRRLSARRFWLAIGLLTACLLGVTCFGKSTVTVPPPPGLTVIAIASDLEVGQNRLPLAILYADGGPIRDQRDAISITFAKFETPNEIIGNPKPIWRPWPVSGGIYTVSVIFPRDGLYRFNVAYESTEGTLNGSATVMVNMVPATPPIGLSPPASETKTGLDVNQLSEITSDSNADPRLYSITVDAAAASGKPTVVVFSTPAFCQTAVCGPQLDVLKDLSEFYGEAANFIHVEVFDNPLEILSTGDLGVGVIAPVVELWGLPSEPWSFIIGGDGRIFSKFEGFTTRVELEESLNQALGGS